MIPLSDIDAHKVLDGARVPISPLSNREPDRFEWCGDRLIRIRAAGKIFAISLELHACFLALDPTQPDVARLLDRRIAGRVARAAFAWADLTVLDREWAIVFGRGTSHEICGVGHLIDVEPTERNIPTARAALIRALYPRTP